MPRFTNMFVKMLMIGVTHVIEESVKMKILQIKQGVQSAAENSGTMSVFKRILICQSQTAKYSNVLAVIKFSKEESVLQEFGKIILI